MPRQFVETDKPWRFELWPSLHTDWRTEPVTLCRPLDWPTRDDEGLIELAKQVDRLDRLDAAEHLTIVP